MDKKKIIKKKGNIFGIIGSNCHYHMYIFKSEYISKMYLCYIYIMYRITKEKNNKIVFVK